MADVLISADPADRAADDAGPGRAPRPPEPSRAERLLGAMTLEEKLAQLVGMWPSLGAIGADVVAPLQDAMSGPELSFEEFAALGLGQLTRPFGTRPIEPLDGARRVAAAQRWLVEKTRPGIPAVVHEECLTGLAAWRATTYPAPLCWGASFNQALVEEMGAAIGEQMSALGVHQGLAPVLDVIRDPRWGRVEECISEDPYLVGELGTAYVRGMQSAGAIATLKHFVGYSNSRAGRNLAPVHAGRREIEDVLLIPFEMAILDGKAGSVMHSYSEVDGVPAAADPWLLTEVLRERWGFEGTVVADYFAVAFLQTLHRVAGSLGDAAVQALTAGVDVELPTGNAYLSPLAERVQAGDLSEAMVDRAVLRVLRQKDALGLLDARFAAEDVPDVDLDPPEHRDIARRLAEESVILLTNKGALPLAGPAVIAVVGPNADDPGALFGCYSFVNHVLPQHPADGLGIAAPTIREAMTSEFPAAQLRHARGCDITGDDLSGFPGAVQAADQADVCVAVVGDRAGLFGRGTSGEGCDTDSLELPGVQRQLVEAVLATGTPVILVLLTGRPYAINWAVKRCAAVVQAFFPGEEGASAVAGVLSGRVNPSGHLPVSMPRSAGAQPYSYLHPPLGEASSVTNLDTKPVLPFGHGLSYTSFTIEGCTLVADTFPTTGHIRLVCRVTNTGRRPGAHVVQVYAHDVVASITRPVRQLVGFARVQLEAGAGVDVSLGVPTARLALTGRDWRRIVEPGEIEIFVGDSCEQAELVGTVRLTGGVHEVTTGDPRLTEVTLSPARPQGTE